MRVFLTGATGVVGTALIPRLQRDGHQVLAWVRSEPRAREQLGGEVELVPTAGGDTALRAAVGGADAVIHLAGENVMAKRWTAARKQALVDSRVETTGRIVAAIQSAASPPSVLLSASAIGIYPAATGDAVEGDPPGTGFLAELCVKWEEAARAAEGDQTRVAHIRIGVVFGREGTALQKMAGPIRARVGGRVGSGKQPVSWIHLDDLLEIFVFALDHTEARGPINATAPEPVTNAELTRELGRRLQRATPFPVPGFALKVMFGEAAGILLEGARVLPRRLEQLGFTFRFPTLGAALEDLL